MDSKSKEEAMAKPKEEAASGKENLLMDPPKGPFKQRSVDGKTTVKETVPKEMQDAAEYWFGKKAEEGRAKNNCKKAGEKLLKLMEAAKKTSIVVFNSDLQRKVRVNILQGAEKLKVEKNLSAV